MALFPSLKLTLLSKAGLLDFVALREVANKYYEQNVRQTFESLGKKVTSQRMEKERAKIQKE